MSDINTNNMDNKENTDDEKSYFGILNKADEIWNAYKHHSGKVSIGLSILGGVSSILVGNLIIAGSVCLAITNTAIFFSGIAYEKLNVDYKIVSSENKSLINEKNDLVRRLTNYHFPTSEAPNSNVSTNTHYEEVKEFNLNRDIIILNSEPTNFG